MYLVPPAQQLLGGEIDCLERRAAPANGFVAESAVRDHGSDEDAVERRAEKHDLQARRFSNADLDQPQPHDQRERQGNARAADAETAPLGGPRHGQRHQREDLEAIGETQPEDRPAYSGEQAHEKQRFEPRPQADEGVVCATSRAARGSPP